MKLTLFRKLVTVQLPIVLIHMVRLMTNPSLAPADHHISELSGRSPQLCRPSGHGYRREAHSPPLTTPSTLR